MTVIAAPSKHRAVRSAGAVAGTATLLRFLLRRDRIKAPVWVAALGAFVVYVGSALPSIAPTPDDLAGMVTLFTEPVGRLFTGPAYGMDSPTYARFFAAGYASYLFLLAGLMNILLITRHTRVDEQTGRAELLRANVTGRFASLTAALLLAVIADAATVIVVTGVAIAVGFPATGSLLIGLGAGATGFAFAGVAAVTAQLTEYSRTSAGIAGAVLGVSFVLRALGDMVAVGGSTLSWISPLGWPAQTAPFVLDRPTPLVLSLALAAVTIPAAFMLTSRRDFGAGLVRPRPGPARARPSLGTPWGLAARLQRGGLLGWGSGIVLLGVADGAFMQALIDAGNDMPPALQEVLGPGGVVTSYLGFLGVFVSVLIAAYAIFAVQTVRAEELHGRAEAVLATAVGRRTYLGAHAGCVAAGAVVITLATGVGTGAAAALVTGDAGLLGDSILAHLALLPGVLALLAFGVAVFGWAPRLLAPLGWAAVALVGIVTVFGSLLQLPRWLTAVSPFEHLARPPQQPFDTLPALVLLAIAAVLVGVGLVGFRRRQVGV